MSQKRVLVVGGRVSEWWGREKVSHEGKQKGQLSWNPLICERF